MLGSFGEVQLMDWGLAVSIEGPAADVAAEAPSAPPAPALATASSPAGTPAFMAPEQTLGHAGHVGPWTDVYLLGGILYLLLTGKPPHDAPSSLLAFRKAQLGAVVPPSERAPGRAIPPDLEELAVAALQPEPSRRPPSAQDFLRSIQEHLTGAANRREAALIIEVAGQRMAAAAPTDYLALTELLNEVARAQLLWPQNTEAAALRERLLGALARQAIAGEDLLLARLTTQQVQPGPVRDALAAEVDAASHARRRRELERAVLRWASAALLVLILGGGGWFITRLEAERRAARDERDAANLARKEAERNLAIASDQGDGAYTVIEYVLRDLKTALDEELTPGRLLTVAAVNDISQAIAGRVATPVVGYFAAPSPKEEAAWPAGLQLKRAHQLEQTWLSFEELGRYAEGLALATRSLAIRERTLGPDHPLTADSLNGLAALTEASGDYAAAQPLYERIVAIREKALGPDHPDTASSLNNLAFVLEARGDPAAARRLYERALAVLEKTKGPEHPDSANCLNNLAALLDASGDHAAARPLYERALAIREKVLGPEHPDTATSLNNLAYLMTSLGDDAAARGLYERALAIWEKQKGPDHPLTASCLNNLGGLLWATEDFAGARAHFERALAIREKALGADHPDTATSLSNLAVVLMAQGNYPAARPLFERALAIREKVLGPDHPDCFGNRIRLAEVLLELGDNTAARRLLESHVAIMEKVAASDPAWTAELGMAFLRLGAEAEQQHGPEQALGAYAKGIARVEAAGTKAAEFGLPERVLRARALFRLGRTAEAQEEARAVLAQDYPPPTAMREREGFLALCREMGLQPIP